MEVHSPVEADGDLVAFVRLGVEGRRGWAAGPGADHHSAQVEPCHTQQIYCEKPSNTTCP